MDTASAYGAEDSRFESWEGLRLGTDTKLCAVSSTIGHFSLAGVVVTWELAMLSPRVRSSGEAVGLSLSTEGFVGQVARRSPRKGQIGSSILSQTLNEPERRQHATSIDWGFRQLTANVTLWCSHSRVRIPPALRGAYARGYATTTMLPAHNTRPYGVRLHAYHHPGRRAVQLCYGTPGLLAKW